MKLSEKQIEELYTFVRKKGIEYIDLQDELVDHLANGIETQCEEKPTLSFADTIQVEYNKFGNLGFDGIVKEKTKDLHRRSNLLYWQKIKQFFKIPHIVFSLSLFVMFYYLNTNTAYFEYVYYLIVIICCSIWGFNMIKTQLEFEDIEKRYFVAKGVRAIQKNLTYSLTLINMLPIFIEDYVTTNPVLSACCLSFFIIDTLIYLELNKEIKKDLQEKYAYVFEKH